MSSAMRSCIPTCADIVDTENPTHSLTHARTHIRNCIYTHLHHRSDRRKATCKTNERAQTVWGWCVPRAAKVACSNPERQQFGLQEQLDFFVPPCIFTITYLYIDVRMLWLLCCCVCKATLQVYTCCIHLYDTSVHTYIVWYTTTRIRKYVHAHWHYTSAWHACLHTNVCMYIYICIYIYIYTY